MALSTAEFWKLCAESRLLSRDECQDRDAAYRAVPGANSGDAVKLAQWLVAQKALTAYQAKVLLSGRPGPFVYGEYKVDDLIGSGRRVGVFRATHLPTGHRVALYALSGAGDKDRARLTLARQKVEVARRAAHPLLLACYEMVEVDGMRFIALEDLAGQSLEEHLAARGSLPVSEACRMGQLSALALSCLHDLGQAHGEMRPANIWFGKSGEIKVLQVPLSRDPLAGLHSLNDSAFDAEQRLSAVADYMAPELTQAGRAPYPAADVYALGCTLYQALSGRVPFAGGDWRQKSARHAMEPVEPLARIGVPVPLSKLILEMLAKEPPQRPPMLQVAKHLIRHVTTPSPPAAPEPPTLNAYERLLIQRRAGQPAAVLVPPAAIPAAPRQPTPPTAAPTFAVLPADGTLPDVTAAAAARSESFSKQTTPTQLEPKPQLRLSKRAKQQYAMLAGALLFLLFSIVVAVVTVTSRMREPTIVEAPPAKPIRRPLPPPPQDRSASEVGSITGSSELDTSTISGAPTRLAVSTQPSVLLTGVEEGDDDGRSLWMSPTNGAPLKLTDVAPGLQWFLVIRPAQLLEHPGNERLLTAIGPAAAWAREQVEMIVGVPCTAIDQLTVAGYEATDASPAVSFVVRLRRSLSLAELRQAWKDSVEDSHNGRAYYQGPQWAYFLPLGENDQLLAIADAPRLKQIMEADGAAPPLPPRLEWLLAYTDQQRLLTIGFCPSALSVDHGPLSNLPIGLRAHCAGFVGQSAKAAIFSAHLDNQLFAELRLRGITEEPPAIANRLRQRLVALAAEYSSLAESGMAAGSAPPSLLLLSQMVRTVFDYTRTGVEDDQAVARWYLPAEAAPHLAAAIMALSQNPSEPLRGNASDAPGSVADKLVRKIDLSFPRETLESAIGQLSHEIGVPIEILGADLQLEGITKNQSFGFDERQRPAGEILRKILWQANPDGKLVYVIKSKVPGGRETLFVTTRAAARRRGDTIPPELDQQSK